MVPATNNHVDPVVTAYIAFVSSVRACHVAGRKQLRFATHLRSHTLQSTMAPSISIIRVYRYLAVDDLRPTPVLSKQQTFRRTGSCIAGPCAADGHRHGLTQRFA